MNELIISSDISIRDAMKKMSEIGEKCLVITGQDNILIGTLSDGDIRKAILKGANFRESIEPFYQKSPTVLLEDKFEASDVKNIFHDKEFDIIPVINSKGNLIDIIKWNSFFNTPSKKNELKINVPVVIMAGGKGTRLEPFTKVLPKPLIPIHEKPIIEHIIELFNQIGCDKFYLTVNYKARILKAYFEELQPDYKTHFISEKSPLGTASSLGLLNRRFTEPFFVTNCDIIIKADYCKIYQFHKRNGYDITLVASAKEYIIPYGTCELNDDGELSHIIEKPHYDFLINSGLYILNPEVIELIPENQVFHITHLIDKVKNNGGKVGVYPIDEQQWIDVGQWTEYRTALENL